MKNVTPRFPFIHQLRTVSKGRRDALTGIWSALVWPQGVSAVPDEIRVHIRFDARKKVVTGEMSFRSWEKRRGTIENFLVGGFEDDSHLTFTYAKKLDRIIGWGNLLLELSPDCRKMTGEVIGTSSHTGEVFHSRLVMLKGKNAVLDDYSILKKNKPTIFIGHGRSKQWKVLERYLQKAGYRVETYESGARAGKTVNDVLAEMMAGASFALHVLTGEDKTKDGSVRARQNVVHETGLFQGRLGTKRAIILLEEGVEGFSNIGGVNWIAFRKNKIADTFREIIATLKREFPP